MRNQHRPEIKLGPNDHAPNSSQVKDKDPGIAGVRAFSGKSKALVSKLLPLRSTAAIVCALFLLLPQISSLLLNYSRPILRLLFAKAFTAKQLVTLLLRAMQRRKFLSRHVGRTSVETEVQKRNSKSLSRPCHSCHIRILTVITLHRFLRTVTPVGAAEDKIR